MHVSNTTFCTDDTSHQVAALKGLTLAMNTTKNDHLNYLYQESMVQVLFQFIMYILLLILILNFVCFRFLHLLKRSLIKHPFEILHALWS